MIPDWAGTLDEPQTAGRPGVDIACAGARATVRLYEDDLLIAGAVGRLLLAPGDGALPFATRPGLGPDGLTPRDAVDGRDSLRLYGVHGLLGVATCPLVRHRLRAPSAKATGEPAKRSIASGTRRTALYVLRNAIAAELHQVHACADDIYVFVPDGKGGRLETLGWPGRLLNLGLTSQEAAVLALLLARRTNAEIAALLVVSNATVRAHCRAVLRKVGAADRRSLWALFAERNG